MHSSNHKTSLGPNRVVFVVAGIPGSGKTTVCSEVGKRMVGISYHPVDHFWETLFANPTYSIDESNTVFDHLVAAVRHSMSKPTSVVLVEGVLASPNRRAKLRAIAKEEGWTFGCVALLCRTQTATLRQSRRGKIIDPSFVSQVARKLDDCLDDCVQINTDELDLSETADTITQLIQALSFLQEDRS